MAPGVTRSLTPGQVQGTGAEPLPPRGGCRGARQPLGSGLLWDPTCSPHQARCSPSPGSVFVTATVSVRHGYFLLVWSLFNLCFLQQDQEPHGDEGLVSWPRWLWGIRDSPTRALIPRGAGEPPLPCLPSLTSCRCEGHMEGVRVWV